MDFALSHRKPSMTSQVVIAAAAQSSGGMDVYAAVMVQMPTEKCDVRLEVTN